MARSSSAQSYSIDLMTGLAVNLRSPLVIQQQKKENQVLIAAYETKSFKDIPYFLLRLNL
jgi:hypothetical protein